MVAKKRKNTGDSSSSPAPEVLIEKNEATGDSVSSPNVGVTASIDPSPRIDGPALDSPSAPSPPIERNDATIDASASPTTVVTIPIVPYPGIEESYLQSFELLRGNAYEAAFSLGRLANAFRFSQFLFYYRNSGKEIGVPQDISDSCSACLSLLDTDTRSAVLLSLLNCMNRPALSGIDDFWSCDNAGRILVGTFRSSLSENYVFSHDTRKKPWDRGLMETLDLSGWLDCFEVLYEQLQKGDLHLGVWMLAGWKIDRLVRPEMDIGLLSIYFDDSHSPPLSGEQLASPARSLDSIDWTLLRCEAKAYPTQDPKHRNTLARVILSLLGSFSTPPELTPSLAEFETFVSDWVKRRAGELLSANRLVIVNITPPAIVNATPIVPANLVLEGTDGNAAQIPKSQKKKGVKKAVHLATLRSFILSHHKYDSDEGLVQEPASMDEMGKGIGWARSKSTLSRYLKALGFEDYEQYVRICRSSDRLQAILKRLDDNHPDRFRTNRGDSIELSGEVRDSFEPSRDD